MTYRWLILLLFCTTCLKAQQLPLAEMRALFIRASESQKDCKQLLTLCRDYDGSPSALHKGYMATANMIMAKHLFSPLAKWNSFQKGKALLEQTITSAPQQIELIFLRYSIQTNLPSLLNYSANIQSDKAFLSKQVAQLNDTELKAIIQNYLARNSD